MTVRELIQILIRLDDQGATVYGVDYEDGAYEVTGVNRDYPHLEGQVVLQ